MSLHKLAERYGRGEARAIYELIMERRFGLSRTDILLGKDTTLSAEDKEELQIILERVAGGEPVQYVLGSEMFCGREFLVGPGVLIPRPETEGLVRLVMENVPRGSTVLDIGTGSGCIAITLALEGYRATGVDVSAAALAYARRNAERLGAEVEWILGSGELPPSWGGQGRGFCIVSNPPYVCQSEASGMEAHVLDHEPHIALFVPDDDPLCFYRLIADYGTEHLASGGGLFFEVNRAFSEEVEQLLAGKDYTDIRTEKDIYGNNRYVCARRKAL